MDGIQQNCHFGKLTKRQDLTNSQVQTAEYQVNARAWGSGQRAARGQVHREVWQQEVKLSKADKKEKTEKTKKTTGKKRKRRS